MAAVARESGLIVGAQVLEQLSWEDVQAFVDTLPPAHAYCTDQSTIYPDVLWPEGSSHLISQAKELTHTIESINANLRHYELAARALSWADRTWLTRMITRRLPLERAHEAFRDGGADDVKVVVDL